MLVNEGKSWKPGGQSGGTYNCQRGDVSNATCQHGVQNHWKVNITVALGHPLKASITGIKVSSIVPSFKNIIAIAANLLYAVACLQPY